MNIHFHNRVACRRLSCALVVLLLVLQLSAVVAGPEFPNPGNPGMSRDQQRQLGLQAAAQVYQQMPILPDSSAETQYVRRLGQKLVSTIPSQYSWPYEFHVVAQKEINAFALPGGPMFVNVGTITAAHNEAELAGVMAHEMAHVYMQHSAKQAEKAQTTGMLAGLAGAILGATVGGVGGQLAQMGVQFGAGTIMLKYSRGDESQADAVGAIILYKAGYNPQAMADFFKTLESEGGGAPPQWLSDHPNPGNREQAIRTEIQDWPPRKYATDSASFQRTKQHAAGLRVYTAEEIAKGAKTGQWASLNKQNGAVFTGAPAPTAVNAPSGSVATQSVMPSQRMVNANLGPMKISHPENWQVSMPRQQGESVTIAPQAGVTQSGVGYGVIIDAVGSPQGERMSSDELTRQLLQQMERSNGVKQAGSIQSISFGGVQGRSIPMQSTSPFLGSNGQQQSERDWLVTAPQPDGTLIYFVFVAPEQEFDRFRPTYEAMLKSVSF